MKHSHQIFICHASVDKAAIVRPFSKILKEKEITYWIDEEQIRLGDSVVGSISKGLEQSDYVLVFLSQHFLGSNWACMELETELSIQIKNNKTRILPVILNSKEACLQRFRLLTVYHHLTLKQNNVALLFKELLSELKQILGIEKKKQIENTPTEMLIWYKQQLREGNLSSIELMFQQSLKKDPMLNLVYSVACLQGIDLTSTDAAPSMIKKLETYLSIPIEDQNTRSTVLFLQAFIKYDFYKTRHWDTRPSSDEILQRFLDLKTPPDNDLLQYLNFSRNFQLKIKPLMTWMKQV